MTIAIMQPYLFPYIGYFQLMNAVDEFIVYDNIEFTKKGWINRNRILVNGKDEYLSFPLKKGSDFLEVKDRELAETWPAERKRILNRIRESYRKAPCFSQALPVIEEAILFEESNLFGFIFHSLITTKNYLGIKTPLIVSSTIAIDHNIKSAAKVMALCKARNADGYINPIGGIGLYDREDFKANGIGLQFLQTDTVEYPQFGNAFIPHLSIIDVMMFNSKETIQSYLQDAYELV